MWEDGNFVYGNFMICKRFRIKFVNRMGWVGWVGEWGGSEGGGGGVGGLG